jgi:NADH-quinone oxidoreductase subunit M
MNTIPWLTLLLLAPPAGMLLIWLAPQAWWARRISAVTGVSVLAVALIVVSGFDPNLAGFQLVEERPWIPTLGVHYSVGVDGISLLFLPATALLFLAVILASWRNVHTLPRLYFSLLLMLETATLGVFCALDTMLFFLFWEMTLVPLYFLVSLWGIGAERRFAAMKYTLIMLAGGVPLLFGLLLLSFNHAAGTGALSFDLPTLLAVPAPKDLQYVVFALLVLGFAVKTPLFPLHTWLPVMAMEGPAAITALLVGLKLGAYGLIRYAIPLAPEVARESGWLLAALGAIAIVYGAVAALAQTNLRRMLAYASLSHVGLVVLGLATATVAGLQGAVLQLLNFTVVASGLFLLAGFLHQRIGSSDILSLGGAARSVPLLASFFLFFGLASLGLPGTSGFPAELLILTSAIRTHTGAGLAALGAMVFAAAYFLGLYRSAFFGPVRSTVVADAVDLRPRELAVIMVFALIIIALGFYPAFVLDLLQATAQAWVARLG